jgi:putative flippase GtrA
MAETARQIWTDLRSHPIKALRSWISVSLIGSMIGTVFDLAVVITLVQAAHFNAAAAAPCGVFVGATANFFVNKIFAFKDSHGHTGAQLARFLGGTALAAAVHAGLVYLLTNKLGIFYVFSKLIADVMVFTVGNLFLLRFVVFPKNRRHRPKSAKGSQPRTTGPR